jgi:hypothetical protein|tara:strand:+ start:113 stop:490 length:378 start_codon:yes stop_codon:yes gene_type:complete
MNNDDLVTIHGDPKTSIWSPQVRDKIYPLPKNLAPLFIDTTYGNDVCPSYTTKDTHLVIWIHDKDTWDDAYGEPIGEESRFQIHYCPDDDAYGQSDPKKIQEHLCKTWEETLEKVSEILGADNEK